MATRARPIDAAMTSSGRGRLFCETILPLLMGAAIYALRSDASPLPAALLWSGPGLFWTYATVAWTRSVWMGSGSRERHVWILSAFALGPAWEFAQQVHWLAGTYDPVDVMFNVLGGAAAILAGRVNS